MSAWGLEITSAHSDPSESLEPPDEPASMTSRGGRGRSRSCESKRDERVETIIAGEPLVLDPRYKPKAKIGQGSYGVVVSAVDTKANGNMVAIKKITNAYANHREAQHMLREICLLRHFCHPSILELLDIISPRTVEEADDVYLVFPLMEADLAKLVASEEAQYGEEHVALIVYRILLGVKALHNAHVIHRDLKPANILITRSLKVQIADFGLGRGLDEEMNDCLTEYVETRWYRAPEVALSPGRYGFPIDIWSVGCILAELLNRQPLLPGMDCLDQLVRTFALLGTPTDEELATLCTDDAIMEFVKSVPTCSPTPIQDVCHGASEAVLDLLSRMLVLDPSKRISVEDAIRHPFFQQFFRESDLEALADIQPFVLPELDHELTDTETIQRMVFTVIQKFRPEATNPLGILRVASA